MWLLTSFLPDWLVIYFTHIIFIAGFVVTLGAGVIARVPFISNYGRLVQPIGIILLIVGVFLEGANWNEKGWQEKVKAFEDKVKIAEQQSRETNQKLEDTLKEKNKVIKERQVVIQEKIRVVESKINAECKVAPEAIQIMNEAAKINQAAKTK